MTYALVLGTLGVLATLAGRGPFLVEDPFESAVIAQAFLITLVTAAFLIAIDVEERRAATDRARSAEQVAESRATLFSTVIDNLDEGVTVITADDDYTVRNRAARRLTGPRGFLRPDPNDPDQPRHGATRPARRSRSPRCRTRGPGPVERTVRETVRLRLPSGDGAAPGGLVDPDPRARRRPAAGVVNTLRDVTRDQEERDQLVASPGSSPTTSRTR